MVQPFYLEEGDVEMRIESDPMFDEFDGCLKDVERGQYLYVDERYFQITLQLDSRHGLETILQIDFFINSEGEVFDEETLPDEDKDFYY